MGLKKYAISSINLCEMQIPSFASFLHYSYTLVTFNELLFLRYLYSVYSQLCSIHVKQVFKFKTTSKIKAKLVPTKVYVLCSCYTAVQYVDETGGGGYFADT